MESQTIQPTQLLSGSALRDIEEDRFSILQFYQRRIARIAPAALLVITATVSAGYFIYSAQDFASVGANGLAAAFSFINIKLAFQGSYFKIASDAQPLVHYWSLAVEEQFYLIFPLFLFGVARFARHSLALVVLCFSLSFVTCIFMTPRMPIASFFLLPTRAWELLAGSVLAAVKIRYPTAFDRRSSLCLASGLIIVLLSLAFMREDGFPGWIAIAPVMGSTLLLAGIGVSRRGAIQRGLAHPAMVTVGKHSYSLYLWHWPIFSLVDYRFYLSSPTFGLALKVILSAAATALTYRVVEGPMRFWLNERRHRAAAFAAFTVAATALSVAGYFIRYDYYITADTRNVATGGISVNPGGRGWVVVIGDSQGAMYGYELASLAHTLGFRLNVLSVQDGNELPGEPNTLWPKIRHFLNDRKPDVVIVAQAWSSKLREIDAEYFDRAISTVADQAAHIIVLTQPPEPPADATRQAILAGARPPFFEDPGATNSRLRANTIIRKIENDRIRVLDVAPIFLERDNSVRVIAPDGRVTYYDRGHLSQSGTALVRSTLEQGLQSLVH